jgi:hypothetical protein
MKTEVEAAALALALQAGAVDVWAVQTWADAKIASEAEPSPLLFEITARSSAAETLSVLNELQTGSDKSLTARLALGHLRRALATDTLTHSEAARILERMAREGYIPDTSDVGLMWSLADDFDLVFCGEYPASVAIKLSADLNEFLAANAV